MLKKKVTVAICNIKKKSKRIKNKNFKKICNVPLYQITLNKLLKCKFNKIYVDTDSDEIKKYCEQDVKVTKKVFDYALKHGHVKFKDGSRKKEIPLDISTWMIKEDGAMTHSLLF